jgi:hypothetical protein
MGDLEGLCGFKRYCAPIPFMGLAHMFSLSAFIII